MTTIYDIGDVIRVTGEFRVSGTLTDPTTVTLKHTDPSGNVTTLTYGLGQVTRSATGVFYTDVTADEAGLWMYQWIGTGAVATVEHGQFTVRTSPAAVRTYSSATEVTAFTRHLLDGQTAYNSTTRPTLTEINKFLERVSGTLNMALAGAGITVPVTQPDARLACDDWATAQATAYVELTQRGAGANENENVRYNTFLRGLYKSAAEFAAQNRLGMINLGAGVTNAMSQGLQFTGLDTQADRTDPDDTSLEQPKFTRGRFDDPGEDAE